MKTLYVNAAILTMDARGEAQAVLTEGARVAAVGGRGEMQALAGKDARVVDLAGQTMCPAFIDPHSHFMAVANSLLLLDLSGVDSLDELRRRVETYLAQRAPAKGSFVVGQGFDPQDMGDYPTLEELNALAPDHALVIQHKSGHAGKVNSLALRRLGLTKDTPDPAGGRIGRDEGGLTGYLEENAFLQAQRAFPAPDMEALMDAVRRAQALYASCGITTVQEGLMMPAMLPMYREMLRQNLLTLDVVGYPTPKDYAAFAQAFPRSAGGYDRHMRLGGLKVILDGSPQARTAYLTEPYRDAPDGYRGYPAISPEETVDAVMQASSLGVQVLMHCNGDASAQQMIDACRRAQRLGADLARVRPVMIHAQMLRPDQMEEAAALHITPSFFVAHVYHWGDAHIKNLGMERASRISACRSAQRAALPFTLHQDAPVIRPDMLETLWAACVRRTKAGAVLGAEERIGVDTALRAVTVQAARQYGEADKGMICPGMRADFAVLSQNPLKTDPESLRDIRVTETIASGKTVWREGVFAPDEA